LRSLAAKSVNVVGIEQKRVGTPVNLRQRKDIVRSVARDK